MTAPLAPPFDVEKIRADFPILSTILHADRPGGGVPLAYLDNAATTQRPRQVIQAIIDTYEQHYANVHRGIHWLSDRSTDLYEQARESVRRFINAREREEVIFTRGTTEGINLVARAWGDANLRAGDEILLTIMEHHSNLVPWQQLAERTGAIVKFVPITDDGQLILDELDELLSPRTKIVAVTAVSNVLGTINPVEEIARRAHAVGAIVLVDAAQSAPHLATDVQLLGADFLAFSGHKLLGPTGVGVLWGRRELLDAMPPFMGGGSMIRRVRLDGFEPADLPAKFEAGTPPIVPAIGLGAAIEYLERLSGGMSKLVCPSPGESRHGQGELAHATPPDALRSSMAAIHTYEQQLAVRAHEALSAVGGVRFLGPSPEHKSGIVSFVVDGVHAHDVAQLLDRQGIAVRAGHHCTMPLHKRLNITASSRASFYFYNTPAEIDCLAAALAEAKRILRRGK